MTELIENFPKFKLVQHVEINGQFFPCQEVELVFNFTDEEVQNAVRSGKIFSDDTSYGDYVPFRDIFVFREKDFWNLYRFTVPIRLVQINGFFYFGEVLSENEVKNISDPGSPVELKDDTLKSKKDAIQELIQMGCHYYVVESTETVGSIFYNLDADKVFVPFWYEHPEK